MLLPTPLSRQKNNVHKNTFGHVLILAGSQRMLGAGALTSLAAMRSGAGLVTLGVPKSLSSVAHKKISNVIMTWPLPETRQQTLSFSGFTVIKNHYSKYQSIALGPGLSTNTSTQKLIRQIISTTTVPLVIDADALNAITGHLQIFLKTPIVKILTPHSGEMGRLLKLKKETIEEKRKLIAKDFAQKYNCVLLLKGPKTVVASEEGKCYVNKTGNCGMATAGSGDVLTGMIAAFLAQGFSSFEAAKHGAYYHGLAGDLAAKQKGRASLLASDIIDNIPAAFEKL